MENSFICWKHASYNKADNNVLLLWRRGDGAPAAILHRNLRVEIRILLSSPTGILSSPLL